MTELATLVQTAQQGNHQAFGQIVHRFQDMAYAYAYSIVGDSGLAQDAAQEAFMDAYQSMATLREPAAFPGWFRRIVFKHSDRQTRGKRAALVALDAVGPIRSPLPDPETLMDEALFQGDVHAAIDLLPPNQSSVVTLFYVEGYSYNEIAAFLEIPVSAIKKRLFNARKNLKERMIDMVQEKLQSTKPSQDEKFANQILFFTALLDNETATVRELVRKDATLLAAKPEWKMAIQREYSIGSTALDLAVGRGYHEMTEMLLGLGADVNATNQSEMTPLHTAAILNQPHLAAILIDAGATVDAKNFNKQTPLHVAAMRNRREILDLLLTKGANVHAKEKHGRTPADWAALTGNPNMVEALVAAGSNQPDVAQPKIPTMSTSGILESGIKIIDLCAPLKRAGINAIFTARSGVGLMVVSAQIVRNVQKIHNGAVVIAGINETIPGDETWHATLNEGDANDNVTMLFENASANVDQPITLLEQALTKAEELTASAAEVLLVLSSTLAGKENILPTLRARLAQMANVTRPLNITVLIYGNHTVGALPPAYNELDSVLTFSLARAQAGLYPAIDPVRSTTTLFENEMKDTDHAAAASQIRQMMTRYNELRYGYDKGGPETLWYIEDDPSLSETLTRARRLDRFFTQPFSGTEPWTGTPGEYVSSADTVRGSQEILAGKHDDVDESEFMYKGAI